MPQLFDSVQPNLELTIQDALHRLTKAGYERIGFIGGKGLNLNNEFDKPVLRYPVRTHTNKSLERISRRNQIFDITKDFNLRPSFIDFFNNCISQKRKIFIL